VSLRDLDQVSAGVVEHGSGHRAHRRRLLRELHTEVAQPFELLLDILV